MLAGTTGNRPQRHAIELASRRWRGGHDSAVAKMRRDSLIYALASTPASKAWMRRAAYASSSGDHLPRRCCDEGDGAGRADDDGAGEAMSPAT